MSRMLGYWYKLTFNMTAAEKALEPAIAALGERYRVQQPFLKHALFADFALLDRKLIIEVDGDSHDRPAQQEKDLRHMIGLLADGWHVVRVTNAQAMRDPEGTVRAALGRGRALEIGLEEPDYQAQLDQLRQNHPELLAAAAKRPKRAPRSRSKTPREPASERKSAARPRSRAAQPPAPPS